jgi:hypothetical protein
MAGTRLGPHPLLLESTRYASREGRILELKGLRGKILKTNEIAPKDHSISGIILVTMVRLLAC